MASHAQGGLTLHDFTPGASIEVWWTCPHCGETYRTRLNRRTKGMGHRPCSRTRPKPGRSLAEVRPDIAEQWDQERNGQLTPLDVRVNASRRVHWICAEGHRWKRDVAGRTVVGSGCKLCDVIARGSPAPGESLAEQRPDLAAEWDHERNGDLTSYDVMPGTGRVVVQWVCAVGHRWAQTPNCRTNAGPYGEHGCPECAIIRSKTPEPGRSFGDLYPHLVQQWDVDANQARGLDPFAIKPFCDAQADWVCERGHRWASKVSNRALGNGCSKCKPTGWSMWEVKIRTELEACGLPVVFPHPPIVVLGRRPVAADIVLPELDLVIECDGYAGHRWLDSAATDRRQTAALEAAGWTVLRIRQRLDPLSAGDVVTPRKASVKNYVVPTLRRLRELGIEVPLEDYEASGPWAVDLAAGRIATYLRDGVPVTDLPQAEGYAAQG